MSCIHYTGFGKSSIPRLREPLWTQGEYIHLMQIVNRLIRKLENGYLILSCGTEEPAKWFHGFVQQKLNQ